MDSKGEGIVTVKYSNKAKTGLIRESQIKTFFKKKSLKYLILLTRIFTFSFKTLFNHSECSKFKKH